jgi:hypothetical protein
LTPGRPFLRSAIKLEANKASPMAAKTHIPIL